MKKWSLRTLLVVFGVLVLVLAAIVGSWLTSRTWDALLNELQEQQVRTANTLAQGIDRELASGLRRLQAITLNLPTNPAAAEHELHQRALGLASISPDLQAIGLVEDSGHLVFNTRFPQLPSETLSTLFPHEKEALRSGLPFISDVYVGRASNQLVSSYVVPVIVGSKHYLLIAWMDLKLLSAHLAPAAVGEGAVSGLLDRNLNFVTRTADLDKWVGRGPSKGWKKAIELSPAGGVTRMATLEGVDSYSAWARLPVSGWTVGIAAPAARWFDAVRAGVLFHLGAIAVLAVLVIAAAYLLGREIVEAAEILAEDAKNVAMRRPLNSHRFPFIEFANVHLGLDRAGKLLKYHDALADGLNKSRESLLVIAQRSREEAERANRLKDEFIAVLGHELRNPLGAIMNGATLLDRLCEPSSRQHSLAKVIQRQSRNMTRLVEDLLDVGRLMGNKVSVDKRPTDLAKLTRASIAALELSGTFAERAIETHLQPITVLGDAVRLEQLVTNLLTNAARYTNPSGSIKVELTETEDPIGPCAQLSVQDDGIGIREEDLERIFELFAQSASSGQDSGKGLGVGLSVVQRVVELHGGTVKAESQGLGRGTTFTVRLPLAPTEIPQMSSAIVA